MIKEGVRQGVRQVVSVKVCPQQESEARNREGVSSRCVATASEQATSWTTFVHEEMASYYIGKDSTLHYIDVKRRRKDEERGETGGGRKEERSREV